MNDRIIQIIPAPPNMWAKFSPYDEDESAEQSCCKVVCLALKEHCGDGEILQIVTPMVAFESGEIMDALEISNFESIFFTDYTIRKGG